MTEPFVPARPGDPISADKWNDMQMKMREELRNRLSVHAHTGGDDGRKLTGDSLDPSSILRVHQLKAEVSLSVKDIDVLDRLNALDQQKLPLSGGTLAGSLSVSGRLGVGTTKPNKRFTVDHSDSGNDHAPMEVRTSGSQSWGVGLVVRCAEGKNGAAVLLRSQAKSWQLRGESNMSTQGFQITEDGGDAEYGEGVGTPRVHIKQGGDVGIGTTTPVGRLDVQGAPRTGSHGPAKATLYVTGEFGDREGVEFRHSNGQQGLGFGYNTLYATGSQPNQDLNLQARGTGRVRARVNSQALELERSLNTGGKVVFLELFQTPGAGETVLPSLRFQHQGRHSSRIEASAAGLAFKTGDTGSDHYVDVSARRFLFGGKLQASGGSEPLRILRGSVDTLARVTGTGCVAGWIGGGVCEITFLDPFVGGLPTIVATQMNAGDNQLGGDARDNALIVGVWHNKARVKTGDANGRGDVRPFHFIVMGPA